MIEVPCSNFEWPIRFSDFNFCFFLYSIIISPIFVEKKLRDEKQKKGRSSGARTRDLTLGKPMR